MLRNTNVLVAKVGFDTAENGPSKIWGNYSLPPTPLDGGPLFGRSSQGGVPPDLRVVLVVQRRHPRAVVLADLGFSHGRPVKKDSGGIQKITNIKIYERIHSYIEGKRIFPYKHRLAYSRKRALQNNIF